MAPSPAIPSPVPRVPDEIVECVIDRLASDLKALGTCGLVCSGWLPRSRYHLFRNVYLVSERIPRFVEFVQSPSCTFAYFVSHVTIDGTPDSVLNNDIVIQICDSLSRAPMQHIESIRLQKIHWAAISFPKQIWIFQCLAKLSGVKKLEIDETVFQDMRTLAAIINLFPRLETTSTSRVTFMKYKEYAITSAQNLRLPSQLRAVHLDGGDAVMVLLGCLASHSEEDLPALRHLVVKNIPVEDLACSQTALDMLQCHFRHVQIDATAASRVLDRPRAPAKR